MEGILIGATATRARARSTGECRAPGGADPGQSCHAKVYGPQQFAQATTIVMPCPHVRNWPQLLVAFALHRV